MKKTFGTHQEVCHVWMSQSQPTGKAGYFRFSGKVLYCDNRPLARIYGERTVLINPNIVENCDMREKIYKAIPKGYKTFEVPGISPLNHRKNISSFMKDIKLSYKHFWTSREGKKNHQWYSNVRVNELRAYVRHFNLKMPSLKGISLDTVKANSDLKQFYQKRSDKIYDQAHEINKRRDYILTENSNLEADWIAGKTDLTSIQDPLVGDIRPFIGVRLRKVGAQIETTLGAFVPVRKAKLLYGAIKAGRAVAGFKIGYYTIDSMNGSLKIGCHEIARKEIDRLALSLGW